MNLRATVLLSGILVVPAFFAGSWWQNRQGNISGPCPSLLAVSGVLESRSQTVTAPFAGMVSKLLVARGDHVQAGETLMRISSERLQAREQLLKAELLLARQQLLVLEAQKERMEQVVAREKDRLAEARIAREKGMLDEAALKLAGEKLAGLETGLAETLAQRADLQGDIRARETDIAALQDKIRNSRIVAPSDGRVAAMTVSRGSLVEEGDSLLPLERPDSFSLLAHVQAANAEGLVPGDPVRLLPEDQSDITSAPLSPGSDNSQAQRPDIVQGVLQSIDIGPEQGSNGREAHLLFHITRPGGASAGSRLSGWVLAESRSPWPVSVRQAEDRAATEPALNMPDEIRSGRTFPGL